MYVYNIYACIYPIQYVILDQPCTKNEALHEGFLQYI